MCRPPYGFEWSERSARQLATQILAQAHAEGVAFDFVCGDEIYGSSPDLRRYCEQNRYSYMLRTPFNSPTLGDQCRATGKQDVRIHLRQKKRRQTLSYGAGDKGERSYAWAWVATDSTQHWLLVRKHLKSGELAYHLCFVAQDQPMALRRLVPAASLRWPIEEDFEFGKDLLGLDQAQVRLYKAIGRHTVLVMLALAVCAVAAARARPRTDTQPPSSTGPDDAPPLDPGHVGLTVAAIKNMLNALAPRSNTGSTGRTGVIATGPAPAGTINAPALGAHFGIRIRRSSNKVLLPCWVRSTG